MMNLKTQPPFASTASKLIVGIGLVAVLGGIACVAGQEMSVDSTHGTAIAKKTPPPPPSGPIPGNLTIDGTHGTAIAKKDPSHPGPPSGGNLTIVGAHGTAIAKKTKPTTTTSGGNLTQDRFSISIAV